MAEEENSNDLQGMTPAEPTGDEKSPQEQSNETVEKDAFSGDRNFFEALDSAAIAASVSPPAETKSKNLQSRFHRFLTMRNILITAIVLITIILAYGMFQIASNSQTKPPISQYPKAMPPEASAYSAEQKTNQSLNNQYIDKAEQPTSLNLANDYLLTEDYDRAYSVYGRLYGSLPDNKSEQFTRDFLQFRMAVCLWEMGHDHQAEKLFRTLSKSNSCPLRLIANYYRALLELKREQFIEAQTCAYRALALASAVTADAHWALSIERECMFIIGQALTRKTLALTDADKDIPEKLWRLPALTDPFSSLTEQQLDIFLNSGSKPLGKAIVSPQVGKVESDDNISHFTVTSVGAPFEELMARFASNADLDVKWNLQPHSKDLLKRPVTLHLPDVTVNEFAATAAGCAGLCANIDTKTEKTLITIYNPADFDNLTEYVTELITQGISLWQQYIIKYHDDKRVANAHFALALLLAQKQNATESIELFRIVANRFPYSSLSPYALLHSSRLKADMHDYFGAREDLKQLIQQYRDRGITPKAYLYLAQASVKANQYRQAAKTYCKVYNLDFSRQSSAKAALEAAKCLYLIKDYTAARTWLERYINLVKNTEPDDLHSAYLLLGRTQLALGEHQKACRTFALTVSWQISDKDRLEIVSALLDSREQKDNLILAMDVLETIDTDHLTQGQATDTLLLKSKIFRKMGLLDKAVALISNRVDYIFEPQLQAKAYLELAQCCLETGNLQAAYAYLTMILTVAEPGCLLNQAQLELAQVSLTLGKYEQTVSLCSQLLERQIPQDMRRRALNLLAGVYKNQKNYDKALQALLAQCSRTSPDEQQTNSQSDGQPITSKTYQTNSEKQDS